MFSCAVLWLWLWWRPVHVGRWCAALHSVAAHGGSADHSATCPDLSTHAAPAPLQEVVLTKAYAVGANLKGG